MRLVVSSVEEFRRVASKLATFISLISIPLVAISSFVPQLRPSLAAVLVYAALAIVVKVALRRTGVNSLSAIRIIEAAALTLLLLWLSGELYLAWTYGFSGESTARLTFNGLILAVLAFAIRKNAYVAKSIISNRQIAPG